MSSAEKEKSATVRQVTNLAKLRRTLVHLRFIISDDLFGEDEVESVSEGGVTGAATFGTKRGRMPSAKVAIAQLYGWSSSGGFAEARCL